jgi:hypothetical protein
MSKSTDQQINRSTESTRINNTVLTELDLVKYLKRTIETVLDLDSPIKYELTNSLIFENQQMHFILDDYLLSRSSDFLTKLIKEYGDQQENIK